MYYTEKKPIPELKNYIKTIWILETPYSASEPAQKIFPDGCIEMVFHYGDRFMCSKDGKNFDTQPISIISGQILKRIHLKATGAGKMIGIRFMPVGAYYFTGMPLNEIKNEIIDLNLILQSTCELEDKLMHNITKNERSLLIQNFILKRIRENMIPETKISEAAKAVTATHGMIKINRLAKDLGISERTLQREFDRHIGLSPKQFVMISRFQEAVKKMNGGKIPLTQIAHDCGYYDQAHFIKEFADISGDTPGIYMKEKHTLSDLFTA